MHPFAVICPSMRNVGLCRQVPACRSWACPGGRGDIVVSSIKVSGVQYGPAGTEVPDSRGRPVLPVLPGASGPQDCGLVYLVQSDPELREQLAAKRGEGRQALAG